jgi:hypothetical protein
VADDRLSQQMDDLDAELAMATRLEEIRSDVPLHGSSFDWKTTETRYAEAFREHGLDVDAMPLEQAAAAIRGKRIHKELIGALNDWARVRRASGQSEWQELLRVAAEVHRDDDPWQERLRHTLEGGEPQALVELAAEAERQDLSPSAVRLLIAVVETWSTPSAITRWRWRCAPTVRRPA